MSGVFYIAVISTILFSVFLGYLNGLDIKDQFTNRDLV